MKAKELIKKMKAAGFRYDHTVGSHQIFSKKGFPPISVPVHAGKDLKPGLLHKLLKLTGLE